MTTSSARFSRRTALAGLVAAGASVALPTPRAAHALQAGDGVSAVLMDRINHHRQARGLPALPEDNHLSMVAAGWSQRMAERGGLSHNGERDGEYGWPVADSGEIVAYARDQSRSPAELAHQIVESWMASAPHRDCILNGSWSDIGVGWTMDGAGRMWATANTIAAALPSPGAEALSLSSAFLPDASAPRIVLSRVDIHPDALAGASLAGPDSPLLLVRPHQPLSAPVLSEIGRVAAPGATVYLVGGAIHGHADQQIRDMGIGVHRLAGADRYATAAAVARQVVAARGTPQGVLLTRGDQWADAVSVAGLAARYGHAVLLVDGSRIPTVTEDVRRELSDSWAAAIGGPGAIPDDVVTRLGATRVTGTDRAETGANVMRQLWARDRAAAGDHLVITPGWNADGWSTALAHATWSARFDAPVLFSSPSGVPEPVRAVLQQAGYSSSSPAYVQFARCVPEPVRSQFRAITG